jgi:hypothetical protein
MMRHLPPEQIDRALAILRSKNEEYVVVGGTGRVGCGYGHRDGVLYRVGVDDEMRGTYEAPTTERALREELAALDLDSAVDAFAVAALRRMGLDMD